MWYLLSEGEHTIRFYANDTIGNVGTNQVSIMKDTIFPVIEIISPEVGEEFTSYSPIYNIEIIETNLDSIWYSLDNGVTNITISELTGAIDEQVWEALPNGYVTIQFYINDTSGKESFDIVIVTKNYPSQNEEPSIPGANMYFIFASLIVGVTVIIQKIKKKKFSSVLNN